MLYNGVLSIPVYFFNEERKCVGILIILLLKKKNEYNVYARANVFTFLVNVPNTEFIYTYNNNKIIKKI